jgi:hypothetical protein
MRPNVSGRMGCGYFVPIDSWIEGKKEYGNPMEISQRP